MAQRSSSLPLFIAALALYLACFGGHYVMGDHAYRMAWAKALLDHGSNDISSYMPGTTYSVYGIGHTLLHVPFLLLSSGITRLTGVSCEGPVNMVPYVLNGAIGVVLIQRILIRHGLLPGTAAVRALIVGVATVWLPYTKVEYSESLVATMLLAMWLLAEDSPLVAGLIGGLAVTFRTEALLWAAFAGAVAPGGRRHKLVLYLGMVPGVLLTAWSNWERTGMLYTSGYETSGFNNPPWFGLYGILFSSGKSVFLFSPLLVLAGGALCQAVKGARTRRLALWAAGLFAGQVLLYSAWWDWSGDDNWGVRFVVPSVMALLTVVMLFARLTSPIFWALALAGLCVQLPAVALGPHTSLVLQHEGHPGKANIYMGSYSPITMDDTRFHPRYSQVTASWELLTAKLTGRVPRSPDPRMLGSTWSEGFANPPLAQWDFFFLMVRDRTGRSSQSAADGKRDAGALTSDAARP
jgi:hypothetical protein